MKNSYRVIVAAALLTLAQSACSSWKNQERQEIIAQYAAMPIILDGKLDEIAWQRTPGYELVHAEGQYKNASPEVQKFFGRGVAEPGKVKVLWDDKYLYVGVEFTDSDIVAESTEDQAHHYLKGDVAEVFIKPLHKTWYWELYVTPRGNKTAYFFPGRGLLGLPSGFPEKLPLPGMKTAASIKGTLNNSWDQDKKWTAEMAIPLAEIGMAGEKMTPEVPWLIFFGRYNYSRYLPLKENSGFPPIPMLNYHYHEGYGQLKMVK